MKRLDLIGQKFGRLIVIEECGHSKGNRKRVLWSCKCDCGSESVVTSENLSTGHTKSCGCLSKETSPNKSNLVAKKFGRLTVIEECGRTKNGTVKWLCTCDCGNKSIAISSNLNSGHTKSCGCYQHEMRLGENNGNWKDGISPENHLIRTSKKYKNWRTKVFERDNWTCQICDKKGLYIQAHHIYTFSEYVGLRFEIWNGITLCNNCHGKTKGKEHIFVKTFSNIVD